MKTDLSVCLYGIRCSMGYSERDEAIKNRWMGGTNLMVGIMR